MERRPCVPREDWRARVEARGFPLHTARGPYWDESACWLFVTLVRRGEPFARGAAGGYGAEGFVFQELYEWGDRLGGKTPVLGTWLVQGEPAGLGVREGDGPITDDSSRFVPHLIDRE